MIIIITIAAVTSTASYVTDKGGHTALYKINNKCIHKTSEIHEHYCIAASYKPYCFPVKPTVFKIQDYFTLLSHSRN